MFNGPFTMTRWVHGAHVRLEKNPRYWDRDAIRLNAIDMPYVTADATAIVNLFKDGSVVSARLGSEQLDEAMKLRWNLGRYNDGSLWYLDFNFRPDRVTRNLHLRKALQLVNDPGELVNKVIAIPGYQPAASLFPAWLTGVNGPFRQEYPPPAVTPDVAKAREHLEIAKRELGVNGHPAIGAADRRFAARQQAGGVLPEPVQADARPGDPNRQADLQAATRRRRPPVTSTW